MTTLDNPITPQNIVDRFKDFVTDTANSNIIWGTDNKPFSEMPDATFSGTTAGATITATGSSIGFTGDTITASSIINALLTETALYTNIRNLRAIKNVVLSYYGGDYPGGGGIVFDATNKSNLDITYRQTLNSVDVSSVSTGNTITSSNLETFFTNLQTEYSTQAANTVTMQVDVCHASCHGNCHSNRGRR
jgi:hypothetical protein